MANHDWSNINSDVLESIAHRVGIDDYVRLQVVCKQWQSVLKLNHVPYESRSPWLLISHDDNDNCEFYNFSEDKRRVIKIPELRRGQFCGSSHGWIIVDDDDKTDCFLLNPITRSRIKIPPIRDTTIPPSERDSSDRFRSKVVLSGNPYRGINFSAVVIFEGSRRFAYYTRGDSRWTYAYLCESEFLSSVDLIYWKEKFYFVDNHGSVGVLDMTSSSIRVRKILTASVVEGYCTHYLTLSRDELLLVLRCTVNGLQGWHYGQNYIYRNKAYYYKTRRFHVFRFDEERLTWTETTDLKNCVLFVGNNSLLSFDAKEIPSGKLNRIYFTDDRCGDWEAIGSIIGHDMGVYDIKNRRIEPFPYCPRSSTITWTLPFWICPTYLLDESRLQATLRNE